MLLRLFTTVMSVWRKYYVMMCYYTFSFQLCVQWIHTDSLKSVTVSVIYAMQIGISCKIRVVVFFFFFPFPESCLLNLYNHTTNQNSVLKNKDFADKGQYHQSYGFSSSHVWMWELDHKEGWVPKNWCLQIVALEKTPLDCKEIKPINPKGNQSWIFIGRADAEAKAPIVWPPDGKNQLIGKDPGDGKDWRQKEKRTAEDEMVGWHHWLSGMKLSNQETVKDGVLHS